MQGPQETEMAILRATSGFSRSAGWQYSKTDTRFFAGAARW